MVIHPSIYPCIHYTVPIRAIHVSSHHLTNKQTHKREIGRQKRGKKGQSRRLRTRHVTRIDFARLPTYVSLYNFICLAIQIQIQIQIKSKSKSRFQSRIRVGLIIGILVTRIVIRRRTNQSINDPTDKQTDKQAKPNKPKSQNASLERGQGTRTIEKSERERERGGIFEFVISIWSVCTWPII